MNYDSVQEILDSGTTNMTVVRNNSKNDDGTDTISVPSWLIFNGSARTQLWVSGNTWIGIASSTESIKVNRRDTASWYVYTEEGTLYDYYQFFRIRWRGYSNYSQTSTSYLLEYDVIFWSTGDISIHMVNIPTSSYDGTFNIVASTTYTYTKPTADLPDVTFYSQDDTNTTFEISYSLIELATPYEKKYLVKSEEILYTTKEEGSEETLDTFRALEATELSAELFLSDGMDEIPSAELMATLVDPTMYYWINTTEYDIKTHIATETAIPPSQTLYSESYDMTDSTIKGVEKIIAVASETARFAISVDEGKTWQMWLGDEWGTLSEENTGMTVEVMNSISTENLALLFDGHDNFMFRLTLETAEDYFTSLIVDYIN